MKAISTALAILGAVIMFAGISTSDYFTMELTQSEPSYVWGMIAVGFVMMIPTIIGFLWSELKGGKNNVLHR